MESPILFIELSDGRTTRRLTRGELAQAKDADKKLRSIRKQLARLDKKYKDLIAINKADPILSKVFYDEAGFPYDTRRFILTGESSLI